MSDEKKPTKPTKKPSGPSKPDKPTKPSALLKPLGKGLSAIFEELGVGNIEEVLASQQAPQPGQEPPVRVVELVDINLIDPNPQQPRQSSDPAKMHELAASIEAHGILEPILASASPSEKGRYELLAGERRLHAARLAGLKKVPCLIRSKAPENALELMLVENLQREDLNPMDEARSYDYLLRERKATQQTLSKVLGKSRAHIANMVGLLDLPERVQGWVQRGEIAFGHAKLLRGLSSGEVETLAWEAVDKGLSVKDLGIRIASLKGKGSIPNKPLNLPFRSIASSLDSMTTEAPATQTYLEGLENLLREALQTKVTIVQKSNDNPGKIVVEFYSNDSLKAVIKRIIRKLPPQ